MQHKRHHLPNNEEGEFSPEGGANAPEAVCQQPEEEFLQAFVRQ